MPTPDLPDDLTLAATVLDSTPLGAETPPPEAASFDDYEIIEEIARGGMGVVYKARQKSLNRIVAIKMILSGELATAAQVTRFQAEAEAVANLQHPHIVAIYGVGVVGDGHYFAMEYVEGRSLAGVIKEGLPTPGDAADYMRKIAAAIHFAHERGIIHRDLKPHNILIDESNQPRVTDFGLAKRLESESDLTITGAVLGTPSYMSPEQADGDGSKVNCSSDVYSLGAILYEMLTGQPPFREATTMGTLMNVLEADAALPRSVNSLVPPDLETICMKCLSKDPARRYDSADALVIDLELFLQGEPIHARRLGVWGRLLRWARHRPLLAVTYFGCIALYAFHLFNMLVLKRPSEQGYFHLYLSVALPLFAASATIAQRLLASERWQRLGQYGYCTIAVLFPTCSFLVDPGPSTAPLQVLLVIIPLSALIDRSWALIAYTTGMAIVAYVSLATFSHYHRPELNVDLATAIPFVLSQLTMGLTSYLMVRRARLAGEGLRFDTSSSVSSRRTSGGLPPRQAP